jgi:hypothetical protein
VFSHLQKPALPGWFSSVSVITLTTGIAESLKPEAHQRMQPESNAQRHQSRRQAA